MCHHCAPSKPSTPPTPATYPVAIDNPGLVCVLFGNTLVRVPFWICWEFLRDAYPGWDCWVIGPVILWLKRAKIVLRMAVTFYIFTSTSWKFHISASLPTLGVIPIPKCLPVLQMWHVSPRWYNCHSLITNTLECLLNLPARFLGFLFCKLFVRIFPPFFYWGCPFLLVCGTSLNIPGLISCIFSVYWTFVCWSINYWEWNVKIINYAFYPQLLPLAICFLMCFCALRWGANTCRIVVFLISGPFYY